MKKIFGLITVLLLMASAAFAQVESGAGAFAGVVQDQTKAAIPGAKVVLSNPGIGYMKEVVTGSAGAFSFSPVTVVGGYTLTVTAPGFATQQVKDLKASVGTVIVQNAILSVGKSDVTIEVAAASVEQVQTDTAAVSQLIDSTIFTDSPLLFRSQNTFVALAAGAAPDSAGTGRGYAVNGARTGAGNFTLEGFDDNDQGQGGAGNTAGVGGAVTTISPDAIQEYRVITSVPNAEYGRAGGFTTDTVLKSGTKQLHGSAFEYNRIQALAQNNFFSNRNNLRDHLIFNQYGGSLGGPIYKDRTFFHATAEFYRRSAGNPLSFVGTTQAFYNFVNSGAYEKWMEGTAQQNTMVDANGFIGTGFCSASYGLAACPGQFADVASLGAVFKKNYAQSPQSFPFGTFNQTAEATDLLLNQGGFSNNNGSYLPVNIYGTGDITQITKNSQNRGTLKIDHKLTEKDQLSFTYSIDNDLFSDNVGGGDSTPGPAYNQVGGSQIFGAKATHTFTPNILNEFRAGYLRHVSNFAAPGTQGIASQYTADSLSTGFGATSGFPQLFTENQFSYEDALTYTHKTHTYKGGFRFVRTRNGSSFYNDVNGSLAFWGTPGIMTDALNEVDGLRILDGGTTGPNHSALGTLYYASASQDPSTGLAPDPYRGYRANEFSAYVQDDWKATSRLTLNYGVRWDYFGPPHNFKAGIDSNVYFGSATTVATTNPFAPGGSLYLGEQSSSFRCVGFNPCGNPAAAAIGGYALASGTSTIWDRDLNNFAPRFGFAYDSFGNGKLVLRGGFGVGFDRLYNNVYENIRFNGPHFVDNTAGYGYGGTGISEALRTSLVQTPFIGNSALTGASPVPRHVNQHLKTAYYEQIHFGLETSLLKNYVVEANYIGTLGRQLVGLENINTFEGRVACSGSLAKACAAAGLTTAQMSTARPSSNYGNDNFRTNGFSSNYSGGQASVRRSFNNGFQALLNYTYSKAMDEVSDVFTLKAGGTGIKTPYNPSHSYGPADFDTRHLASFTVNYTSHSSVHKLLLAGWGISPIVSMHSGTPIYATDSASTYDPNKDGTTGVEKAVYAGPGTVKNAINHHNSPAGNGTGGAGAIAKGYFKPYVCPANVNSGLFCDVPGDRQELYGLRYYDVDLAVSKHIALTQKFNLTLQAAFFDVDGHTQFANPSADVNSSNFGYSTSAGNRQGQLSGRIDF